MLGEALKSWDFRRFLKIERDALALVGTVFPQWGNVSFDFELDLLDSFIHVILQTLISWQICFDGRFILWTVWQSFCPVWILLGVAFSLHLSIYFVCPLKYTQSKPVNFVFFYTVILNRIPSKWTKGGNTNITAFVHTAKINTKWMMSHQFLKERNKSLCFYAYGMNAFLVINNVYNMWVGCPFLLIPFILDRPTSVCLCPWEENKKDQLFFCGKNKQAHNAVSS